jgi:hypothetical protein
MFDHIEQIVWVVPVQNGIKKKYPVFHRHKKAETPEAPLQK